MKLDLTTGLILLCAIMAIGSIGMCAFAIFLYHRDGGTRSTKTILSDAMQACFPSLSVIWERAKK